MGGRIVGSVANLLPKCPGNRKRHRIWTTSFSNLGGRPLPTFHCGGLVPCVPPTFDVHAGRCAPSQSCAVRCHLARVTSPLCRQRPSDRGSRPGRRRTGGAVMAISGRWYVRALLALAALWLLVVVLTVGPLSLVGGGGGGGGGAAGGAAIIGRLNTAVTQLAELRRQNDELRQMLVDFTE